MNQFYRGLEVGRSGFSAGFISGILETEDDVKRWAELRGLSENDFHIERTDEQGRVPQTPTKYKALSQCGMR